MLIKLLLLFVSLMETLALRWTSSSTFPNGTRVNACLGGNATFPWKYDVDPNDDVIDVEWYQIYQNREIPMAALINDRFLVYPTLGGDIEYVPNAGIRLLSVSIQEMEDYSVRVNLNGVNHYSTQTAFLRQPEAPVTVSGRLEATILPESQMPIINGESHLQLGCGAFQSLGEPPMAVRWRTPDGQFSNSTYNNGDFILTLPRPIEGGNYSCQLAGSSPVPPCLQNNPLINDIATVNVDADASSMLLLMNDNRWLLQENARLSAENLAYAVKFEKLDETLRPADCVKVKVYDDDNGVHTIYPNNSHPIRVYCDQNTDNGGWTMIQRRLDGSQDFYRNWADYESGFGTPESEYWIGLQNLQVLTTSRGVTLRVDLMTTDAATGFATYNNFSISGQQDNYRLRISGYLGTAGDMLSNDTTMQFSTFDRDHDLSDISCAQAYHGAWWYHACSFSNLNGGYGSTLNWGSWTSLQRVEMKIRM